MLTKGPLSVDEDVNVYVCFPKIYIFLRVFFISSEENECLEKVEYSMSIFGIKAKSAAGY